MHGSGDNQSKPNVQKSKIQSYSVVHCTHLLLLGWLCMAEDRDEGKDGLRRMAILGHSSVMEHKCPSSGSRARA